MGNRRIDLRAHCVTRITLSNQNAYAESFNGRLRDECLNEHWFTSLTDPGVLIEAWRRDYNEHRPKKDLGGIPPAVYAVRRATMTTETTARP